MTAIASRNTASILLVDDMEDNLTALEAVLDPLNQRLVRARSGPEAMKALLREQFAVVLLDVVMPDMDGFETAANIKRLDQTKDVPIIFLTGVETSTNYLFRGYATGAVDYLAKPFDPWVLRAKVSVFLDLHLKNRQLQEILARDWKRLDEFGERLERIESQFAASRGPDVAGMRHHLTRMRESIRELREELAPHFLVT
ncbi:response regulator [Streptomyces sp. CA-251387]|uniref:response regulator n=1 Tax=Streptomyces sp. CA-251387 TaxID=3240064 RepID=UPI003D8FC3E9